MEIIFEILKTVLPVIITGIITFLIAKYSYNNNKPLDKLEIAYNRVYYPLYKLIKDENVNDNLDLIIDKAKFYLKKYDKYVDRSTSRAFYFLCDCNTNAKKKDAYQNFKNNIYDRNSYLRRKLGYLEPSFLQIYTYSSKSEKSTLRILMELCGMYLFLMLGSAFKGNVQIVFMGFFLAVFLAFIYEIVCKFVRFLYYKIKK